MTVRSLAKKKKKREKKRIIIVADTYRYLLHICRVTVAPVITIFRVANPPLYGL